MTCSLTYSTVLNTDTCRFETLSCHHFSSVPLNYALTNSMTNFSLLNGGWNVWLDETSSVSI